MTNAKTRLVTLLAVLTLAAGCGGEGSMSETASFPTAPLIDPNTASEAALGAIPGLPEAAVNAIVAGRPFATPGDLNAAIGGIIGEENASAVYSLLFVKVGLNSGAEDDYRLIPSSMSARQLAHEFEEYRPYESIEQFQREMSKYVSDEEVAYLTRYVTLD